MLTALFRRLFGRKPHPITIPHPAPPPPPPADPPAPAARQPVPPFHQPAFVSRPDRPATSSQIRMRANADAEWDFRRNVSAVRNPYATPVQNSEYLFHYQLAYDRLERDLREARERGRRAADSGGGDDAALLAAAATVALDHSLSNDDDLSTFPGSCEAQSSASEASSPTSGDSCAASTDSGGGGDGGGGGGGGD